MTLPLSAAQAPWEMTLSTGKPPSSARPSHPSKVKNLLHSKLLHIRVKRYVCRWSGDKAVFLSSSLFIILSIIHSKLLFLLQAEFSSWTSTPPQTIPSSRPSSRSPPGSTTPTSTATAPFAWTFSAPSGPPPSPSQRWALSFCRITLKLSWSSEVFICSLDFRSGS